jgi:hypothetical protein
MIASRERESSGGCFARLHCGQSFGGVPRVTPPCRRGVTANAHYIATAEIVKRGPGGRRPPTAGSRVRPAAHGPALTLATPEKGPQNMR